MTRSAWQTARSAAREIWPTADPIRNQTFADLLTLTDTKGWQLLVHRRWAEHERRARRAEAGIDAVVIGPPGVFVLAFGERDTADRLLRASQPVEVAVGEMSVTSAAVQPVLIQADTTTVDEPSQTRRVNHKQLVAMLYRERKRPGFHPRICAALADHLANELTELQVHELAAAGPSSEPAPAEPLRGESGDEEGGLFSEASVERHARERAMGAPIEGWMTYLEPRQLPLVRRDWGGPARITGPAGTGKTVVGLHRAAYLAQRTDGRVLYVTYASNLPRVQESFMKTMSPYVCGRVDFRSLYKFVLDFLKERRVPNRLDGGKADDKFFRAWSRIGCREHPELARFDSSGYFWRDEISHVIKGRGITTLEEYRAVPRRGRGPLPRGVRRESVWRLYEVYQALLRDKGLHDFQDVLALALAELRKESAPSTAYTSVIVDEAQDLPQLGVQLLHALVGDAQNGLLLIGDGQQAVYPGGFRLSDAGIDVRGDRGQVLRSNYRNAPQIISAALRVVADVPFEDLDGTSGRGARDVELTCQDGTVTRIAADTRADHDHQLVSAVRADDRPADAAVLCATREAVTHYRDLLRNEGIPVCPLDTYDGSPVQAVKLGTYIRAKGLDFKHVYLPRHDERLGSDLDRSRLFVAMTRARDALWLGSVRPAGGSG